MYVFSLNLELTPCYKEKKDDKIFNAEESELICLTSNFAEQTAFALKSSKNVRLLIKFGINSML